MYADNSSALLFNSAMASSRRSTASEDPSTAALAAGCDVPSNDSMSCALIAAAESLAAVNRVKAVEIRDAVDLSEAEKSPEAPTRALCLTDYGCE